MPLPIAGPGAITLQVLPGPGRPSKTGGKSLGVQTAELAKRLGSFILEKQWADRAQVICSHRGLYQGDAEAELTGAGVVLRHIALFIGDDHSFDARTGVVDIAVVTKDHPQRAVLLIEIEKNGSGTTPKAVIGDSLLPVLADHLDVLQENGTYSSPSLDGAEVWVGYHPRKGYDAARTDRLTEKVNGLLQKVVQAEKTGPARIRLFNQRRDKLCDTLLADARCLLTERISGSRLGGTPSGRA
jgi:hypothetical protein